MNEWLWEMKVDEHWLSEGKSASLRLIWVNLTFSFFLVSATWYSRMTPKPFCLLLSFLASSILKIEKGGHLTKVSDCLTYLNSWEVWARATLSPENESNSASALVLHYMESGWWALSIPSKSPRWWWGSKAPSWQRELKGFLVFFYFVRSSKSTFFLCACL